MVEDSLLDRKGGNPNKTHTLGLGYLTKLNKQITYRYLAKRKSTQNTIYVSQQKISKYIVE